MGKSVPTAQEITDAQLYALSKLCTEIPNTFGAPGLTEWDESEKVCKITEKGCQMGPFNPISVPPYNAGGESIEYDEHNAAFGEFWRKHPPGHYSWKVTKNSPTRKVCSPTNFLMKRWCESPETRANGKYIKGVTDGLPLEWKVRDDKEVCEITREYCKSKGVSYDEANKDCFVSDSQKVAEFFSGSVLVRKNRASDSRLKKIHKLIRKDYPVKGVNVYVFEWNDVALTTYGYSGIDVGFIADELDPKYVIRDSHGFLNINLQYDDDTMRKIYTFLKVKEDIKNVYINK